MNPNWEATCALPIYLDELKLVDELEWRGVTLLIHLDESDLEDESELGWNPN